MFISTVFASFILALAGCSNRDRERADAKAEEARREAHKLGEEAKGETKQLSANVDKALQNDHPGETAERKLDHAATIAKVRASLVGNIGLTAAAAVGVDAAGSVVTLSGTLSTEDEKRQAEKAASQVDGVSQVVDHIEVKAN